MSLPTTTTIHGKIYDNRVYNDLVFQGTKIYGFKYPIPTDPKKGYFTKSNSLELVRSNLSQLLKTSRGERFMLPLYGCNLKKYLMEPLDEALFASIRDEILYSLRNYTRNINIDKIQIFEDGDYGLRVSLFCTLIEDKYNKFEITFNV